MRITTLFTLGAIASLYLLLTGCISSRNVQEQNVRQQLTEDQTYVAPIDSTYEIRPGDQVEILVWQQPNFNTSTTVSGMGTIVMPLLGEIQVVGMTRDELKRKLRQELSRYIKNDINLTVSIRSTDNMMVSVFGMVSEPDNYPVVDKASILKVLSMAGGPSEQADLRNVKIYRRPSGNSNLQDVTIDLTEFLDNGRTEATAMVYPGDVVYVPEEQNVIRETSQFLRDIVLLFGIFRVVNN
ncbi:MAG TPA: polysaccharide biosynthesis/export family protein [Balneolaceae bacterium]|nr:polysaccharide biosynthesis/export family protein [Balneolaceae bacterium]